MMRIKVHILPTGSGSSTLPEPSCVTPTSVGSCSSSLRLAPPGSSFLPWDLCTCHFLWLKLPPLDKTTWLIPTSFPQAPYQRAFPGCPSSAVPTALFLFSSFPFLPVSITPWHGAFTWWLVSVVTAHLSQLLLKQCCVTNHPSTQGLKTTAFLFFFLFMSLWGRSIAQLHVVTPAQIQVILHCPWTSRT